MAQLRKPISLKAYPAWPKFKFLLGDLRSYTKNLETEKFYSLSFPPSLLQCCCSPHFAIAIAGGKRIAWVFQGFLWRIEVLMQRQFRKVYATVGSNWLLVLSWNWGVLIKTGSKWYVHCWTVIPRLETGKCGSSNINSKSDCGWLYSVVKFSNPSPSPDLWESQGDILHVVNSESWTVKSFSTFGNVLIHEPKQAITQSRCKFEVTGREACFHEVEQTQNELFCTNRRPMLCAQDSGIARGQT